MKYNFISTWRGIIQFFTIRLLFLIRSLPIHRATSKRIQITDDISVRARAHYLDLENDCMSYLLYENLWMLLEIKHGMRNTRSQI